MKKSLLAIACLFSLTAWSNPPPPKGDPNTFNLNNSNDNSNTNYNSSGSSSSASAGASANANNAVNTSSGLYGGNHNYYALPYPVTAAPLPPGICPKGDSLSWSIGWNFFSYAVSSTRTELDCLEKVLAVMPKVEPPRLPATDQIHPPVATPVVVNVQPATCYETVVQQVDAKAKVAAVKGPKKQAVVTECKK